MKVSVSKKILPTKKPKCIVACQDYWLVLIKDVIYKVDKDLELSTVDTVGGYDTMKVSPNGQYVAVYNKFGLSGQVIDITDDRKDRLHFHRKDYHAEVSEFPVALIEHEGKTILIHSTAWNRLELTDVESQTILHPRPNPVMDDDSKRDKLDYFFGSLTVSPNNKWVVSSGWVWHPVGAHMYINLEAWLSGDTSIPENAKGGACSDDWNTSGTFINDSTYATIVINDNIDLVIVNLANQNKDGHAEEKQYTLVKLLPYDHESDLPQSRSFASRGTVVATSDGILYQSNESKHNSVLMSQEGTAIEGFYGDIGTYNPTLNLFLWISTYAMGVRSLF